MQDDADQRLRRLERDVERKIRGLAADGELQGLPGEGAPLPEGDAGPDDTWAARHLLRTASAAPVWVELRKEIDERAARLRRRLAAHREWLHDRTRLLAELPADRIVDAVRATEARDVRIRAEIDGALSELNALIRRYDLLVVPALQLPLVTLERLQAGVSSA
jgi:hypothetical protein